MTLHPVALWIGAFFLAARATRYVNADKLFSTQRIRWRDFCLRRAAVYLTASQNLVPDEAERRHARLASARAGHADGPYTRRQRRRYYARAASWQVYRWFLSCMWCVGFWIFLVVDTVPWLILGCPGAVLGMPWWWAILCLAAGGNWVYGLLAARLDHVPEDE